MIIILIFAGIGFLLAGLISYFMIQFIVKSSLKVGLTTVDAHKSDKPIIAEPGGLSILLSFIFAFSFVILLIVSLEKLIPELNLNLSFTTIPEGLELSLKDNPLVKGLVAILAITIAGLIGLIDDIFGITLKWRHKILLGFLPALPLMIFGVGNPTFDLPFLGIITLPIIYPFVIIPLATNFAFNSYNMVAGYNGLEAGMGIISFSSIFIVMIFFTSTIDPLVIILCGTILGSLLMFFIYNKYPAKILMGDVGTLMIGTALVVALVIGNIERLALGIFFLYVLNFMLFFVYRLTRQTQKLADIEVKKDKKVVLRPPCPYTVYWILPYYRNTTERENVFFLFMLQIIFCALAIGFFVISTT